MKRFEYTFEEEKEAEHEVEDIAKSSRRMRHHSLPVVVLDNSILLPEEKYVSGSDTAVAVPVHSHTKILRTKSKE